MKENIGIINNEDYIGLSLGRTVKLIEYHLQDQFNSKHIDLTKEQLIVLKRLSKYNGISQNELAILMLRNKSSLTRLLSKMENKNYISREQNQQDKRIKEVFITSKGRSIIKQAQPILKGVFTAIEKNISQKEKQQIMTLLKTIQKKINSKEKSI